MTQIFGLNLAKYRSHNLFWPAPFQKYMIYIVNVLFFHIPGQILPNSGSFWSIFGFRTQLFGLRAQIFWPGHVKYDIFDPAWPRSFQKYIIYRVKLVYFTTVVWQVLLSRPPPRAIFWSILTDENREQPRKICKPDFSKNCWSCLVSASLGRKFRFPTEVFSCPV